MITINKAPQLYTTLNLALFQVTSDRPTILMFDVEVLDGVTDALLGVQRYATLPMTPRGTYFDLAPILSSFVEPEILTANSVLLPTPKTTRSYKLAITEIYLDAFGAQLVGSTLVTGVYNIFNATLSRPDFRAFDYRSFVQAAGLTTAKFLSLNPLVKSIYYDSKEYLYLIANADFKVEIKFYRKGNVLAGTQTISQAVTETKGFRINLSPNSLAAVYGGDLLNFYGMEFSAVFTAPFGSKYSIKDANYFTVRILNAADAPISELRTYAMKSLACRKNMVELFFTNSLGGVDSMAFLEPRQTVSSAKQTIDVNPYQLDGAGAYSDINAGIFNPTSKTISSKSSSSFSIVSEPLTDETSLFARALIESNNVYVKTSAGDLLPVVVMPQDYLISKRKYSTDNTRLALTFKIVDTNFNL